MQKLAKDELECSSRNIYSDTRLAKPRQAHRWLRAALIVTALIMMTGFALLAYFWPFTQSNVTADLAEALQGSVKIGKFSQTYFPYPGCIAEDVTFTNYGNLSNPSAITVRRLIIQSRYPGLFAKHINMFRVEGLHISAPNTAYLAGWSRKKSNSQAEIEEFVATESILEFQSEPTRPPLAFQISLFALHHPGLYKVMRFETILSNPEPPGEVRASGSLGPWKEDDPSQTPIAGSYSFQHAALDVFQGIAGTLSSDGTFQGVVQQIDIQGKTDTPDFEVSKAEHKISLSTQFQAHVNARNGDVKLEEVSAHVGKTSINSSGSIAGSEGQKGKTASLLLSINNGRIQDFLFLFLKEPVTPMTGRFNFKGQATLPPQNKPFLQKVALQGSFGIDGAHLSSPTTQAHLEKLSQEAEGEKNEAPESVVSDLQGHVVLKGGTATFSNLSFAVPGATARLQGTYNLIDQTINLRGNVFMKAKLSQTTSGVKSFLLKVIDPLLKKNRRGGAVVPVHITGTYSHPIYTTDPI